jgi:AcrR family transcriptional regulator
MPSVPQTARSERTRAALRQAAMQRFLSQGVDATTAEQVADDAGVSLRTFYRHFANLQELLFADYDSGLQWFRGALAARPAGEPIIASVRAAIFAFPYDVAAITELARLRAHELDPAKIVEHLRRVEADFASAIIEHLRRRPTPPVADLDVLVTARSIAAAVFAAMDVWMLRDQRTMADLAALSHAGLDALERGIGEDGLFRHV